MKIGLLNRILACVIFLSAGIACQALEGQVVANESVAATSLDASALKDLYTGKTMFWPGGGQVVIVVLTDVTDAAVQEASGMDAASFKTFWQRLAFSGRGQAPKRESDLEKVLALVASTKGAVAIVPKGTDTKSLKKIEIK